MATSVTVDVIEIDTQPYQDQKPGTSGLRKKVNHFQQPNYLENFIQSVYEVLKPKIVVLGGDKRFWSEEAIKKIMTILVANGVEKIVVGSTGLLSTPAASALIRKIAAVDIGIILTASHNPGGPEGDFGVKINGRSGEPSSEEVTDKIYEFSKTIKKYKTFMKTINYPMDKVTVVEINDSKIAFVDPVANYAEFLETFFDFSKLRLQSAPFQGGKERLTLNERPFKMLVDCMNGATGPYVRQIIGNMLNVDQSMIINDDPLPDFGGKHPDPNLTYAKELVDRMKADPDIDFGIAFDGDGDRNMVLGPGGFFVSPGDALAIFAKKSFMNPAMKQFTKSSPMQVARSFPTSPAVDRVCAEKGWKVIVTPTGWKYFSQLILNFRAKLCGEESFGQGSFHLPEKDGVWACLVWMSIIYSERKSVKEIVEDHWKEYGRDYFNRYDFEDCDGVKCNAMVNELRTLLTGNSLVGKRFGSNQQYLVVSTGDFEYTTISGRKVPNQGLFVNFEDSSRIIVRISGTGSSGATVRIYLNAYSKDDIYKPSEEFLKELLDIAYEITKLREFTGREKPDVIT